MRYSSYALAFVALAQEAIAYPHIERMLVPRDAEAESAQAETPKLQKRCGASISGTIVPDPAQVSCTFNPKLQYVNNTGAHAWQMPAKTDQRGPCPGLNAMANHNYIPRNGIATIAQFVQGTYDVFGMGTDLATFLAVYGAVFDGDLTSWSIGGPPSGQLLGGLLNQGRGISGSHNNYEGDASPVRGDLYEYGNDYENVQSQWKALYAKQSSVSNAESNYNLAVLQEFRSERFDQSIANNPYFFNGPFTGIAVQPAAYTFIYRFMANKSAEHPEGQLTQEVLKSFYGFTQQADGSFTGGRGYERIPDNWYKRAIGDEYTIPFFALDLNQEALAYPKFLDVGGNLGKPNTFTGVDINNLTGGVYNAQNLAKGNNALCFAFEAVIQAAPGLLRQLFSNISQPLSTISSTLGGALTNLGCPQLQNIDFSQFNKYPGYTTYGSQI